MRILVQTPLAGFLSLIALVLIVPITSLANDLPREQLKSGFETMGPDTQAMQRNDAENPAMLWVREGERLWHEKPNNEKPEGGTQACSGCHGDAPTSMKGVATRYPAYDSTSQRSINLTEKIQQCRVERQTAAIFPQESRPLLSLTAYIGMQSRGEPILKSEDSRLDADFANGKALFNQRMGQLNLSCAACHTDNWGRKLGSSVIPQGHANGYPLYRLEWQNLGSLQRRIRNCMIGVRAEPFAYGDQAMINLEIYLNARAVGLKNEVPAVRP